MLTNKVKNLNYRADVVSSEPTVPDPWQIPVPVQKTSTIPETWHLPLETNPVIRPAGNPDAPKLVCHQSTSEEILLGDELRLKASAIGRIEQQLEKALALLYWLKTIDRAVVSS